MKTLAIKAHMLMMQKKMEMAESSDRGATAVEYGLIVALIAIVIVAALILLGGNLTNLFNRAAASVNG